MLRALVALLVGRGDAGGLLPAGEDPYAKARERQEDIKKSIQTEIHKTLISNTLDYIKTTTQVLSGITGVLLSTYIALLVGFRRDSGVHGVREWLIALVPVILWLASLTIAFVMAVASPRFELVILDLRDAMETYASVLRARRRQLIVPALLTFAGLVAFAVLFNSVFVAARVPATTGATSGTPPAALNTSATAPSAAGAPTTAPSTAAPTSGAPAIAPGGPGAPGAAPSGPGATPSTPGASTPRRSP